MTDTGWVADAVDHGGTRMPVRHARDMSNCPDTCAPGNAAPTPSGPWKPERPASRVPHRTGSGPGPRRSRDVAAAPELAPGKTISLSGDRPAWLELTDALDWLPLACLVLAGDGTALAVSQAWSALSGLSAEDSRADGWTRAVDLPDRGVLRARLRDAAVAGRAGYADFRLAGAPAGRWSRWWWGPGPSGQLIVCVADLGDSPDCDDPGQHDGPVARLVRRSEFVNLAGRALRRSSYHVEHVAVAAVRLNDIAVPGSGAGPAGDLLRAAAERISAAGPVGAVAQVAPGEFVILLDGLRAPCDSGIIPSHLHDDLSKPLEVSGTSIQVTAVTSVAIADAPGCSAEELIEKALIQVRLASRAAGADLLARQPPPAGTEAVGQHHQGHPDSSLRLPDLVTARRQLS
jgi:hypothetical protein